MVMGMKYAHAKTFPQRCTKIGISGQIADKAIKRLPSDTVGKDLRRRLDEYWNYSWGVTFDPKNGEVWLNVNYSWVTHSYLLDGASSQRLRDLKELVDQW